MSNPLTALHNVNSLTLRCRSNIRDTKDFRSEHTAIPRSSNAIDTEALLRRITAIRSGRRTDLCPTVWTLTITKRRRTKPLLSDSLPLLATVAHNPIWCLGVVVPRLRSSSREHAHVICWVGLSPDVTVYACLGAVGAIDPAARGGRIVCCSLRSGRGGDTDYVA